MKISFCSGLFSLHGILRLSQRAAAFTVVTLCPVGMITLKIAESKPRASCSLLMAA